MSTALVSNVGNQVSRAVSSVTPSSMTQSTPSTPSQQKASIPQQSGTPGAWRHPRFDEIARRRNATVFNNDNIRRILYNSALIMACFFAPSFVCNYTPQALLSLLAPVRPYQTYMMLSLQVYFLFNIFLACTPLLRAKDDMADIPLTPSQRALLGLKPSNTPLTPGEQYTTPPRYARSSTPRSSTGRAGSGSPLSGRGTSPSSFDRSVGASQARRNSASPFGGVNSPLVQKALSESTTRRLSFGKSASPLGQTGFEGMLGTPTPGVGNGKASVGLNSKWLYERGRSSPSGRSLFS